jgi:hypothetical protein
MAGVCLALSGISFSEKGIRRSKASLHALKGLSVINARPRSGAFLLRCGWVGADKV